MRQHNQSEKKWRGKKTEKRDWSQLFFTLKIDILLACVSDKCRQLATSNRFGRDKYLLCLNCFSNSSNCCDVNAVRGRLVFPNIACGI